MPLMRLEPAWDRSPGRGRVREARLTDLAALGELSRLSHHEEDAPPGSVRTLGLPVAASQLSMFSLFRLPLGAFRPHDQLYVYEEDRKLAGLLRVERDGHRDEWTIVELDAVGQGNAGDIRFRLVQHLLRDGAKRGAIRFHVACADEGGNVEIFMQAGFMRYGEETILFRPPGRGGAAAPEPVAPEDERIRPASPLDALVLSRLYQAVTPHPVLRLEDYRLADWERQGSQWRIPRSSLAPILRFADVEAYVQECPPVPGAPAASGPGSGAELAAFLQVGVAKDEQPHYLKLISRPEHDPTALLRYGIGVIQQRSAGASGIRPGHRHEHGIVTAVRTYEAPLDRRMEEHGFEPNATVSLLMKETLVRIADPALVPAVR